MEQKERLGDLKSIEKQVNYRLRRYDVGQIIRITWIASDGNSRNIIVKIVCSDQVKPSESMKTVQVLDLGELSNLNIYGGLMAMLVKIILIGGKSKLRELSDKEALLYAL